MQPQESGFSGQIRSLLALADAPLRTMPLLPAAPAEGPQLDRLRQMAPEDLFAQPVQDRDFAKCVQAGLYLYFSALDEAHTIAQGIPSASGSYWHGILHRQEGDWSNAKYWFRRVGAHAVLAEMGKAARAAWDPHAFIDRCAAAAARSSAPPELVDLQMQEWRCLMLHCHGGALGLAL